MEDSGADGHDRSGQKAQTVAVLIIGIVSGFSPALQPLLLGQLAAEGKISLAEIGQTAMLEALGMLLAASVAGAFLKPERIRTIATGAIMVAILVNLATAHLPGDAIKGARFVGGMSAGILLWIWIGLLARSEVPARLIAIYVTLQAAALLGLSAIFAAVLLPWGGAGAGYGTFALIYGLLLLCWPFVPHRYRPLEGAGGVAIPTGRGLVGLVGVFLHLAGIMCLWVYVVPLATQAGLSEAVAGTAVSVALAAQIGAGIIATVMASRLNPAATVIGCALISILAIAVLATVAGSLAFIAATALFAFLWMFAPPFQMPYLIAIDPTRKAAIQMLSAQLLGVAVGPAVGSLAVAQQGVSGALFVSAAMFAGAALIVTATTFRPRVGSARPA